MEEKIKYLEAQQAPPQAAAAQQHPKTCKRDECFHMLHLKDECPNTICRYCLKTLDTKVARVDGTMKAHGHPRNCPTRMPARAIQSSLTRLKRMKEKANAAAAPAKRAASPSNGVEDRPAKVARVRGHVRKQQQQQQPPTTPPSESSGLENTVLGGLALAHNVCLTCGNYNRKCACN